MGFGLSAAAGGSSDALQELLKRKFLEQIQTQRLNEDARQADMRNVMDLKQLEATEGLRRDTQAATQQYRDEMNKDRDLAREQAARLADETRHHARIKLLPTGTRITGQQAVDFGKFGTSPLLEPAVNSAGEPEFKFRGTQDSAEAEARAVALQHQRDIANAAAEERLRLSAEVAAGRMSMAAANLELRRIQTALDEARAQKPGAVKVGYTADQTPIGYRERPDGTIEKVDLPPEFAGTGRAPLTSAQIEENARAAAAGREAGKGSGNWFTNLFSTPTPAPAPTTPAARPAPKPAPKTPQEYDWVNGKLVPRKAK